MDYLLWTIMLFIGMFAKCFGALLAFGIAYYIYKTYVEKLIEGDKQSLSLTKIYKTMEAIHWILIIMLMLCSYQLGKLRTLDWVNKKLRD